MGKNMIFMYPMQEMLKKKNLYCLPSVEFWRMNLDISCASLTETVCLGEVGIQTSTSVATLQGNGDH